MNVHDAIQFLTTHQPFPSDEQLMGSPHSKQLLEQLDTAAKVLEVDPHPSGLKPLLRIFNEGSAFGVYDAVLRAALAYPENILVTAICDEFKSPVTKGQPLWLLHASLGILSPVLLPHISRFIDDESPDVRTMAAMNLAEYDDPQAREVAIRRLAKEDDPDVQEILRDIAE